MIKKAVPYILLAPFIVLLLILLLAAANSLMQGLGYMPLQVKESAIKL